MRPGPFVLAAAGCATLAAARPVAAQEADQPAAVVQKAPAPPAAVQIPSVSPAPYGFYRDGQGRVMQVSFDLQRRLWLGVAYSPRRRPTGDVELSPAAFDFGASWEGNSPDGRTRHRLRFLDGEVRLHPYGWR